MRQVRAFLRRLAGLFGTESRERDLQEEIESHVRMHTEDRQRAGVGEEEARRLAILDLGGLEPTKEQCRRRRGLPALEAIWQDTRHGFRLMRKNPAFTLVAVLTLALGIGANSAIFSVVNGVLLRPLPYEDAERIVQVWHVPPPESFPGLNQFSLSAANYLDWRARNHVFERMAAYGYASYAFNGGDRPEAVPAGRVAPDLFAVLRARPLLGRPFLDEEDAPGRGNVVILSHAFWKTRFGSDETIVGREIRLNGAPHTVVGVMPADFRFPSWARLWVPLAWSDEERAVRGNHNYHGIARLKPGVELEQAQAELSAIASRLEREYPEDNKGWGATIVPLRQEMTGNVRPALLVLFGAVAFVLLIACANIANLLLSRTLNRRKEIALRAALGAGRGRVLQQILCETVLLALSGGGLGLIVARAGVEQIARRYADLLPRAGEIALDGRVLAFTFAVSVLAGLAAGILPAWRLTKSDLNQALRQGLGRTDADSGGGRARAALLIAQVASSLVLLVGAGLMIRTLSALRSVDPGFDPRQVVTMSIELPGAKYPRGAQRAFFENVLERVRAIPGVESAGAVTTLPVSDGGSMQPVAIEGRPALALSEQPEVAVRLITPQYLRTLRLPLRRGRDIDARDGADQPAVVLVSESMAERFWPGEDAIGKRLVLSFFPGTVRTVVGVVGDVKQYDVSSVEPDPTLYAPHAQIPEPYMALAVRRSSGADALVNPILNAIRQVDSEQPVLDVAGMEDLVERSLSHRRFSMILLTIFAGLALVLATIGVYSVLSYAVGRRVQEIGIRMALGARRRDVLRMVMGEGLRLTVAGLAVGACAAIGLSRLLRGLLFGVRPTDPLTFAAVSLLLGGVALLACFVPARRAARVDPMVALRNE